MAGVFLIAVLVVVAVVVFDTKFVTFLGTHFKLDFLFDKI